jgi:transposase-like protein
MFARTDGNIFSFYGFPKEIRRSLYTSNAIEGFNAKLKRETRKRILMNSEGNATVVITAICRSYNSWKLGRVMNGLKELNTETRRGLGFDF